MFIAFFYRNYRIFQPLYSEVKYCNFPHKQRLKSAARNSDLRDFLSNGEGPSNFGIKFYLQSSFKIKSKEVVNSFITSLFYNVQGHRFKIFSARQLFYKSQGSFFQMFITAIILQIILSRVVFHTIKQIYLLY